MIKSARIKNFKGFSDLSLSDLSRITLLGGSNDVGKSSVLEALFLFYDRANPNIFFRQLVWRGITSIPGLPETTWGPMFYDYQMERKIIISVKDDIHDEAMEIEFDPTYFQRTIEMQLQSRDEKIPQVRTDQQALVAYALKITYKFDAKKDQKVQLIIRLKTESVEVSLEPETKIDLKSGAIFLPARIRVDPNEEATRFGALDIMGKQDVVFEVLKLIEPRLRSLSSIALGQTSFIHGDIGIGRKIPVAFMGDGAGRLLSIILAIASCKDGIVFIDEVENGIYYSTMAKVWEGISKVADQFNCQVIATTHSYECLQAAHEGISKAKLSKDFRYIRLDRIDGDIISKVYTDDILEAALERGWEVR